MVDRSALGAVGVPFSLDVERGAGTALITMCAGGAMATATIIERL